MRADSARRMHNDGRRSPWVTMLAIFVGTPVAACLAALFIGALVVGAKHLRTATAFEMGSEWHTSTCPAQPLTAVYLFVQGIISLVFPMVLGAAAMTGHAIGGEKENEGGTLQCVDGLLKGAVAVLTVFVLVWTLLGAVWVLGAAWPDSDNPTSPAYCDALLYWWSFALVCAMAAICVLASPIVACLLLMGAADIRSQANTERAHTLRQGDMRAKGIMGGRSEDEQEFATAGCDQQSLKHATPVDFLPAWRHDQRPVAAAAVHSNAVANTSSCEAENQQNLDRVAISLAYRRETPV